MSVQQDLYVYNLIQKSINRFSKVHISKYTSRILCAYIVKYMHTHHCCPQISLYLWLLGLSYRSRLTFMHKIWPHARKQFLSHKFTLTFLLTVINKGICELVSLVFYVVSVMCSISGRDGKHGSLKGTGFWRSDCFKEPFNRIVQYWRVWSPQMALVITYCVL